MKNVSVETDNVRLLALESWHKGSNALFLWSLVMHEERMYLVDFSFRVFVLLVG